MERITESGKVLIINKRPIQFEHSIYRAEKYKDYTIVLLDIQSTEPEDLYYELYSVSKAGEIKWKMHRPKKSISGFEPKPVVDFSILDDCVVAVDSSFRKFIVDSKDGTVIDYHFNGW